LWVGSTDETTQTGKGNQMVRTELGNSLEIKKSELFTMLSGLEAIVYVADMETYEVLAVNRVLEDFYGPNLVGRKCYEVLQRGQTEPCPFCTNDKLMKDGEPTGPYAWRFKNTLTGRWYSCIDKAVMWPDGRHVRLEVAFDITEAEAARAEAESARDLLELYNDILLHDLGNFAGATLGYLDLALQTPGLGEEGRSLVASARGQAGKCNQLIDKISKFSKALTTKDEARHGVSLDPVLDEAIDEAIQIHTDQKPVIRKEYGEEEHIVRLGAFAKDVFLNLLTNAVKYGDGKEVVVRIGEDDLGGRPAWKVSIIDNGPGISPEDMKKLFQRYSRLDTSERQKGKGLGLSIARTVANRYGGEIRVEDRVPGDHTKGACFIVVFPKA
jgi:two-component system phosphate regulon sensor histidine kinase PhoR